MKHNIPMRDGEVLGPTEKFNQNLSGKLCATFFFLYIRRKLITNSRLFGETFPLPLSNIKKLKFQLHKNEFPSSNVHFELAWLGKKLVFPRASDTSFVNFTITKNLYSWLSTSICLTYSLQHQLPSSPQPLWVSSEENITLNEKFRSEKFALNGIKSCLMSLSRRKVRTAVLYLSESRRLFTFFFICYKHFAPFTSLSLPPLMNNECLSTGKRWRITTTRFKFHSPTCVAFTRH